VQTGGQVQRRPIASYTRYHSASEIAYTPDGVLREGLGMVESVNSKLEHLDLGSKLRKEVWLREGGTLKEQTVPRTMIAVCGATGSGKSYVPQLLLLPPQR
jgi:ABC-type multidrug transport system fused ATPase/permease subunit